VIVDLPDFNDLNFIQKMGLILRVPLRSFLPKFLHFLEVNHTAVIDLDLPEVFVFLNFPFEVLDIQEHADFI
jgi:hypothetical protein